MLMVNLIGILLIAFIIWWFWLYHPATSARAAPGQIVEIHVKDGVYSPASISAVAGKGISLKFIREDSAANAAQVIFPELGIQRELPLDRAVVIRLVPEQSGDFSFQCQTATYRGLLHVHAETKD